MRCKKLSDRPSRQKTRTRRRAAKSGGLWSTRTALAETGTEGASRRNMSLSSTMSPWAFFTSAYILGLLVVVRLLGPPCPRSHPPRPCSCTAYNTSSCPVAFPRSPSDSCSGCPPSSFSQSASSSGPPSSHNPPGSTATHPPSAGSPFAQRVPHSASTHSHALWRAHTTAPPPLISYVMSLHPLRYSHTPVRLCLSVTRLRLPSHARHHARRSALPS